MCLGLLAETVTVWKISCFALLNDIFTRLFNTAFRFGIACERAPTTETMTLV